MNEPHQDLAQQALVNPIKYTLMLTKEIIYLNKKFFISFAAIMMGLGIASMFLPSMNLFFSTFINVLLFCLFFFVGKTFDQATQMNQFITHIQSATLNEIWSKYVSTSIGAYLGWIVAIIPVAILIATVIFGGQSSEEIQSAIKSNHIEALAPLLPSLLFALLIIGFMLYITPLVFVNILRTNTFNDAFKSVFTLFQPSLWSRSFTGAYFKYMTVLGLVLSVIMVIFVLLIWLMQSSFLSPIFISLVGMAFLVFTMFTQIIVNIIYAISAIIADRLTQNQ